MGTNTGKDYRIGSVRDRVQRYNKKTGNWEKVDTNTGEVVEIKEGNEPFKGVAQQIDDRRE